MESPATTENQTTNQVSSVTKSTKAPKRANLISLGFKPIAKPSINATVTVEEGESTKATEIPDQYAAQNLQRKPRRITFTTGGLSTGEIVLYYFWISCNKLSFCKQLLDHSRLFIIGQRETNSC